MIVIGQKDSPDDKEPIGGSGDCELGAKWWQISAGIWWLASLVSDYVSDRLMGWLDGDDVAVKYGSYGG
ncbi:hypothetical protein WN944_013976 [Citrus x changshan-huyou]|uniref:Uncharacterized protein n=1 Tax=Citrus x changshan-huyou TaxID=2935761 RepID=A0AAP0M9T0_9ROSI